MPYPYSDFAADHQDDVDEVIEAAHVNAIETALNDLKPAVDGKQPLDSDLTAIAALSTTAYGRALLALADAAAGRTALGLGTASTAATGDFQPADSDLTALAALATTAYGRSLLEAANAAALRTLAGLVIGTDVQAHSTVLDATTASFTTADETKLDGIETAADVTDATNVAAAGAVMDGTDATLATAGATQNGVASNLLLTPGSGHSGVNGLSIKVPDATWGDGTQDYGTEQPFVIIENGAALVTDATSAGSILYRIDRYGGVGCNNIHIAGGLRTGQTGGGAGALWVEAFADSNVMNLSNRPSTGDGSGAWASKYLTLVDKRDSDYEVLSVDTNGILNARKGITIVVRNNADHSLVITAKSGQTGSLQRFHRSDGTLSNGVDLNGHFLAFNTAGTTALAALGAGDTGYLGVARVFGSAGNAATHVAWFQAAASQTGDLLRIMDSNASTVFSRFNKAGYFMTRKTAAPADADLVAGELAMWFDSTNGASKAMFKGKSANGTVVTANVALA